MGRDAWAPIREPLRRAWRVLRYRRFDSELAEEMEFHRAMKQRELEMRGADPTDASFAARRALGSIALAQDHSRDVWRPLWLQDFGQDVRFAARNMRRQPGFSAVAVLTLTLGIGANTAIFSVVNTVLLKPLKAPDAATLVRFVTTTGATSSPVTGAQTFEIWRRQTSVFAEVAPHRLEFVNLSGGSEPEQIPVARVTAEFFPLFRARPQHGRWFTAVEDRPNGGAVAVMSYGLWTRRFGSDPRIVGQAIPLGRVPHVIVGILSADFDTEQFDPRPDLWVPFQLEPERIDGGNLFIVTGRLKPGITIAMANAQLGVALADYAQSVPGRSTRQTSWMVQPLQDAMIGSVRSSLNLLLAAVGLVLLIACANVASLLLVRADVRKREMAIRAAIGAARGRIIRQLLTESVVLSLTGGLFGLAAGPIAIRALLSAAPESNPFGVSGTGFTIPRIGEGGAAVVVDWRVLTFTVLVSVVTGFVFGLLPGFHAARTDLYLALKQVGGAAGSSFRRNKARALLVVTEVALALMLLVCAALLIRTSLAFRAVQPGFTPDHVLTLRMSVTATRFETRAGISELTRNSLERIRAVPGVIAASTTCCMPLETVWQLPFVVASRPQSGLTRAGNLAFHAFGGWTLVSPGYFDVFRIPLLRGRDFADGDDASAPGVVLINQEMARRFWPSSDPLNDRLIIGRGMRPEYDQDPVRQIVGIVGDVRDTGLNRSPRPAMYVPTAQVPDGVTILNVRLLPVVWVVRTAGEPYSVSVPVKNELQRASGGLPVARIRSMGDVVAESTARTRFDMWLMTIFGCSALLLAAVGIYGVMAYSVQQRTKEIGIRLALGAGPRSVRSMVLVQGMTLTLVGVGIGLAAALGLTRIMASFLFGVTPRDPLVFVCAPLLLSAVAFMAVWLPGRVACRVDPVIALRAE
jgi:putative ABC transport system permease protein